MINIDNDEIKQLELLGFGSFGRVYKKDDDTVYKIYNDLVREDFSKYSPNPCLKHNKTKYMILDSLKDKLEYTDLYKDFIYMNDKFAGIALKYYDGKTLNDLLDEPFELKMNISRQLVRNSEELSFYNIYPLDCKLNNVMYCNGEVKIIDLDDTLTKVSVLPNYFYRMIAIYSIIETLKIFFREYRYSNLDIYFSKYLKKDSSKISPKYKSINNYLDNKEIKRDYLIVDNESDLSQLKVFLECNKTDLLYSYHYPQENKEMLVETAKKYYDEKIPIYEFVDNASLNNYFNDHGTNDVYEVKNKVFIKK